MINDSFIPNSFSTPNAYVDRLMALLTSDEYKVLSYAARRIFGFQKRADHIALSQFADGVYNRKTGERHDYGTGLSVGTCRRVVHTLVQYGILLELAPNDSKINQGPLYALQLDADRVDFAGLETRRATIDSRNNERMARTRGQAIPLHSTPPPAVVHTPLCDTEGGMSYISTPLMSDSTTPPTVTQQHKTQRNTNQKTVEGAPKPGDGFDWGAWKTAINTELGYTPTWTWPAEIKAVKRLLATYPTATPDDFARFLAYAATLWPWRDEEDRQVTYTEASKHFGKWFTGGQPAHATETNHASQRTAPRHPSAADRQRDAWAEHIPGLRSEQPTSGDPTRRPADGRGDPPGRAPARGNLIEGAFTRVG